ncbi:DsbA family oxidoreductase [Cupriavidus necator]|uniref:DsbA family oxidoreductase n=1 Tax=Cupriavidus necator TaxID=106590 RepID=UPI0027803B3C|nr:DsbA family oxidoreductase [Cupriavidus necator]MDQ0143186.1 putative DsbA family dithiol-disulfide isomerase [Cupriavidus necator]
MNDSLTLSVEVCFDLICPWCLIGKRHLDTAIARLASERPDIAVNVAWRSCPLIPSTPPAGMPYREFYVARLGSPEAVKARQAQVCAAAQEAGLTLALDRIETFPSTLLAHRLVRFAREQAGAQAASDLIGNLLMRYFIHAQNIGDPQVLGQALQACGIPAPGPAGAPVLAELDWLPPLRDAEAPPLPAGHGVPHFVFNGKLSVSGARPPAALLQVMYQALARTAA